MIERGERAGRRRLVRSLPALALWLAVVIGAAMHGDGLILLAALALAAALVPALLSQVPRRLPSAPGDEALERGPDRGVIAALPVPVIVVDRRGTVIEASAEAETAWPALRIGHPLALGLRAPAVLEAVRDVLATGAPRDVEHGGRTSAERTYRVRMRPLPSQATDDGRARSAMLFFHDLSAERRLETMRADFVATASHELRTPLASLSGFIDTLQGPARDDQPARERFLAIMRTQADRMTRLVDDLLQLSRVELGAHRAPAAPVDLGPLVGHMVEIMTPLARERSVDLAMEADGDGLLVAGDRDELLRVVENLVENAIRYGGDGGRVEVGIHRLTEDGAIELGVRDHGPGIAAEHLPRLTERFYRVAVAQSRAQGGTGLGLAIVKHIVAHHRGRLTIESKPGHGTWVRVRLPALPSLAAGAGRHATVIRPS